LAAVVFFRDARSSFEEEFEGLLKSISPIFAITLASVVRGSENEADDTDGDTDSPFLDKPEQKDGGLDASDELPPPPKKKQQPKIDPADWWKRGEAPPF
jgi:hypothetical protein